MRLMIRLHRPSDPRVIIPEVVMMETRHFVKILSWEAEVQGDLFAIAVWFSKSKAHDVL